MKIKSEFILREVAGENVAIFLSPEFQNKIITLNATGAFIMNLLKEDVTKEKIVSALTEEYDIDAETAENDAKGFIESLKSLGAIEE